MEDRLTAVDKLLVTIAKGINWDEQNASQYYIGEDAAEAVLVWLGFSFEEGINNEAVERFLATTEKEPKV